MRGVFFKKNIIVGDLLEIVVIPYHVRYSQVWFIN
jgi:hypothetical protein